MIRIKSVGTPCWGYLFENGRPFPEYYPIVQKFSDVGASLRCLYVFMDLTRFNKIAIQGTPQMAVDKEAICLSRVYSYYPKCNFPLFYV